jgi:hypothetical protein
MGNSTNSSSVYGVGSQEKDLNGYDDKCHKRRTRGTER